VAKQIEFLSQICSTPGTNERLHFDERGHAQAEDGSRYRSLRGVPILRAEPPPTVIMPSSHVSGGIAQDRIDYMCDLSGYALLLGGGNLAFSHPNVVDVEFNLYTNTDVVADAHLLPFQDDTFDLFFAMNVFEHLRQPFVAAKEALRVLKPGAGFLYIAEPVMAGSYAELMRPYHDETEVRRLAVDALARCIAPRFAEMSEHRYAQPVRYTDFDAFLVPTLARSYNDHRREAVDTPAVRALFEAGRSDDGFVFEHRTRVNLYRGAGA